MYTLNLKESSTLIQFLKFAYTKLAVVGGKYQQILYDSASRSLVLTKVSASSMPRTRGEKTTKIRSKQTQSQAQASKKIPESEREKLEQIIVHNSFFQTDVFYVPDLSGPQNYTLMVLAVNLDGKSHTIIWTDTSQNVPTGLSSIVKGIEEIAAK
jgi:hypothetical protein